MKVLQFAQFPEDSKPSNRKTSASDYRVYTATRSSRAYDLISRHGIDLVVFDLEFGNLDVLQQLLEKFPAIGVLVLATKSQFAECLVALDAGADDFAIKPVKAAELERRIYAIRHRCPESEKRRIMLDDLTLDIRAKQVYVKNIPAMLTPSEYKILESLMKNKCRVLSHSELNALAAITSSSNSKNTIEAHICSLRRKLDRLGLSDLIKTHRGFGYVVGL